jgi:hypothetical protein
VGWALPNPREYVFVVAVRGRLTSGDRATFLNYAHTRSLGGISRPLLVDLWPTRHTFQLTRCFQQCPLPFAIDGGLAGAEAFLDLLEGSDVANGQCSAEFFFSQRAKATSLYSAR